MGDEQASQAVNACSRCGKTAPVTLKMEPGVDGERWRLCVPCWREPEEAGLHESAIKKRRKR